MGRNAASLRKGTKDPRPAAAPGAATPVYGLVRWADDELDDGFVIVRVYRAREEAEQAAEAARADGSGHTFNVVVLHPEG